MPVPEVPAPVVRVAEGQLQAAERLRSDRPTSPALGQERLCAADDIPLSKQVRPAHPPDRYMLRRLRDSTVFTDPASGCDR